MVSPQTCFWIFHPLGGLEQSAQFAQAARPRDHWHPRPSARVYVVTPLALLDRTHLADISFVDPSVRSGFPPSLIDAADDAHLSALGFRSGDTLIVAQLAEQRATESSSSLSSPSPAAAVPHRLPVLPDPVTSRLSDGPSSMHVAGAGKKSPNGSFVKIDGDRFLVLRVESILSFPSPPAFDSPTLIDHCRAGCAR